MVAGFAEDSRSDAWMMLARSSGRWVGLPLLDFVLERSRQA